MSYDCNGGLLGPDWLKDFDLIASSTAWDVGNGSKRIGNLPWFDMVS